MVSYGKSLGTGNEIGSTRESLAARDVWTSFGSIPIKSVISFPIIWAESSLSFARESAGKLRKQDIRSWGGGGGGRRGEGGVARASGKAASSVDARETALLSYSVITAIVKLFDSSCQWQLRPFFKCDTPVICVFISRPRI